MDFMADNINAMISNREVIDRIDSLLKQRNLKRNALYDFAGLPHNTFSNWSAKEGTKIPAQALYTIARFFGVTVEYLLTGNTSAEPLEVEPIKLPPQNILDLAYEINALPDVYKRIVVDTVRTLSKDASGQEKAEIQNIG